jgi:hypothetical protein
MATRYPLIVNPSTNQIQEIPLADTLDLSGNFINQINVTGISTLGAVQISSGIVTASSGIVTYYGDGSKLSGISKTAEIGLACSDETTSLTTGTAKVTFRMPYNMTLSEVRLNVNTAPTGSALVVNVLQGGSTVFSTKPQIDAGTQTSVGSGTTAVISDSSLASDAEITIDIDQIGSGTEKGKGLKIWLIGTRA